MVPDVLVLSKGVSAQDMAPAENSPARGYLEAHRDTQNSLQLLGSPLSVTLTQEDGAIYVALLPLFERAKSAGDAKFQDSGIVVNMAFLKWKGDER
jgi:hypothetical protein